MIDSAVINVSYELDSSGLVWCPEIGDEISLRDNITKVSILVDPEGMTPTQLRKTFLWLPTLEQLVAQIEARQGLIFHAGINDRMHYEAVIKTSAGLVEACAQSLRVAFGLALKEVITEAPADPLH